MSLLHPRVHIPTWAAATVVAAAYVVRSAMRGWDLRPDLPWDAIILVTLVALLAVRAFLRHKGWDEPSGGAEHGRDEAESDKGEDQG